MIQTDIHFEITDTFGGEANYSWVRRGVIRCAPGESYSDLAAVRRVKKAIDWCKVPCKREDMGDTIALYPYGAAVVCFITFREHGSCE